MTREDGPPILQFENVTRVYRKGSLETHALRGLDLTVNRGEFVAIWGPSGSGKTTALNLVGALDTPTSDTVKLEGSTWGSSPAGPSRGCAGTASALSSSPTTSSPCSPPSRTPRPWSPSRACPRPSAGRG